MIKEACGLMGIAKQTEAARLTYFGLYAQQHRGQEGAGIVSWDGERMYEHKGMGLAHSVFDEPRLSELLRGDTAIGHVRYSTAGGGGIDNVQPFVFRHHTGDFSLCHNGNIVNSRELKMRLELQGSIFQSSSDTEILAHLIKMDLRKDRLAAIIEALNMIEGAYAFLIMAPKKMFICRDKNGLRPLSIGTLNGGYVFSSETCAFEAVGATFLRDVKPGEMILLEQGKTEMTSFFFSEGTTDKICSMEYIYFARPDSDIEGTNVHSFRKTCGKLMAQR